MEFLPVPIRSLIKVVVPLPAGEAKTDRHCILEAEVLWRTFKSTGVRFLDPPEDVLEYVRGVVEHGVPQVQSPELYLTN